MTVRFEWNKQKADSNYEKHDVEFEEAATVFDDPLAVIFDDSEHSEEEQREIVIGHSVLERLMLVCFIEREEDVIRIISARLATKRERNDYEENSQQ